MISRAEELCNMLDNMVAPGTPKESPRKPLGELLSEAYIVNSRDWCQPSHIVGPFGFDRVLTSKEVELIINYLKERLGL